MEGIQKLISKSVFPVIPALISTNRTLKLLGILLAKHSTDASIRKYTYKYTIHSTLPGGM